MARDPQGTRADTKDIQGIIQGVNKKEFYSSFNPNPNAASTSATTSAATAVTPKTASAVNTNTLEGILAASNAAPPTAPAVDVRAALAKLTSGQELTDDEKRALGFPVATPTPTPTPTGTQNGLPAGFTAGPFPKELEQFFGSSSGILGYRIETLTDKDGRKYNQLSVATGPNSSQTFGAGFVQGADGKYSAYSPNPSSSTSTTSTTSNTLKTPEQIAADAAKAQAQGERQSAYDLLYSQFKLYGLESLVEPLKGLITSGASPAEFTIKLRESDAYKLRFAANAKRIANGFKAIDEATYLGLEDRYQSIMQNYGLPESYYKKGSMGTQEGLEKFIANNVDPVTLEERIMEGVKINQGSKLLIDTAKQFYPSLTDGDFLAYALDPKNALSEIRRKVTASEIGSAQIGAGLAATVGGAEELARAGITGKQYQQAAPTIAEASIRGGQLADIYKQSPYTQQTAEQALLDLPGSAEALRKTKKLTSLETAAFGGSAGAGAIARDRAGVL
jgi:hypothetical protein